MVTRRMKVLEAALQDIYFFSSESQRHIHTDARHTTFSEVVVSSAKISDAAASSLMNTQ